MKKEDFNRLFDDVKPDERMKNKIEKRLDGSKKERRPHRNMGRTLKWAIPCAALALILTVFPTLAAISWDVPSEATALTQFQSYSEAEDYVVKQQKEAARLNNRSSGFNFDFFFGCGSSDKNTGTAPEESPGPGSDGNSSGGESSSSTNVQVNGVDESDVVKNDGRFIYSLSFGSDSEYKYDRGRLTLAVTDAAAKTLETHDLGTWNWANLYLSGDKLVVFGGRTATDENISFSGRNGSTDVLILDAANPDSFPEGTYFSYPGTDLVSSRRIDGKLYLVMNSNSVLDSEQNLVIPSYVEDGTATNVEPTDIYAVPGPYRNYSMTDIVTIDLEQENQLDMKSFFGPSGMLYVNRDAIYTAITNYSYRQNALGHINHTSGQSTVVNRYAIGENGVDFHSTIRPEGTIINQFAMDEYDGTFRIATTVNSESSGVTVYDIGEDAMTQVGQIGELGKEKRERIYSVRFDGVFCYLTTARQTDPLFVVDLTDKTAPEVTSELKIPDVSDYMHMYDEDTIIGIGRQSNSGAFYGVQITLFDVSDKTNAKKLDQLFFETDTHSEVSENHKAFLFHTLDGGETVFGLPVAGRKSGFVLFVTDGTSLSEVGFISVEQLSYNDNVFRGVIIGDTLYAVTNNEISYKEIVRGEDGLKLGDVSTLKISKDDDSGFTHSYAA